MKFIKSLFKAIPLIVLCLGQSCISHKVTETVRRLLQALLRALLSRRLFDEDDVISLTLLNDVINFASWRKVKFTCPIARSKCVFLLKRGSEPIFGLRLGSD